MNYQCYRDNFIYDDNRNKILTPFDEDLPIL